MNSIREGKQKLKKENEIINFILKKIVEKLWLEKIKILTVININ